MAFCEKCGSQTSDEASFCRTCGASTVGRASQPSFSQPPPPPPPPYPPQYQVVQPRRTGRAFLWIGGVVAVILVAVILALATQHRSSSGSTDYSSASLSGGNSSSTETDTAAAAAAAEAERAAEAQRAAELARQQQRDAAVAKDRTFLDNDANAKDILGFLHPTATYHGEHFLGVEDGADGDVIVQYSYDWDQNDSTTVSFHSNSAGAIQGVSVVKDTSDVHAFVGTNLAIQVFGQALIEDEKDKMTDEQKQQAQQLLNSADAKGLLELCLLAATS